MSFELALISRIMQGNGHLTEVLDFGVATEDFTGTEARAYWNTILAYYQNPVTAGSVLDQNYINLQFKNAPSLQDYPNYTTKALCHEVRNQRIKTNAVTAVNEFADQLAINPDLAIRQLHSTFQYLINLGTAGNTDLAALDGMNRLIENYEKQEAGLNVAAMPWPWAPIQEATGGVQPDDFIVFYGRPKSMKTWVLAFLIAWAWLNDKRIVVYTKEMTPDNVYKRVAACIAYLPYDDLRHARLSPAHRRALYDIRDYCAEPGCPPNLVVLSGRDTTPGGDTVGWLQSKIEKYKPDVMFVDGMYLLSDSSSKKAQADHVRVMNISRELRQMVLGTGVPVIATMQANRKAAGHTQANTDEVAYSDALSQDATILSRVIADKESPTISLVMAGSREFKLHGMRIHGIPATNFSFHSILTEKEIEKAKEKDAAAEEKVVKKVAAKKGGNAPRAVPPEGADVDASLLRDAQAVLEKQARAG